MSEDQQPDVPQPESQPTSLPPPMPPILAAPAKQKLSTGCHFAMFFLGAVLSFVVNVVLVILLLRFKASNLTSAIPVQNLAIFAGLVLLNTTGVIVSAVYKLPGLAAGIACGALLPMFVMGVCGLA